MVLVYGIGICSAAAKGDLRWKADVGRVLGVVGLIAVYLVLGAAASWLAGAQSAKEAIAFGLGWQGLFGHFTRRHLEEPSDA
jgi:hypothetical protein